MYDLWRKRFFLRLDGGGGGFCKKNLKKTPAGRVSPEQPVGGIGLRASGSRAGQSHNIILKVQGSQMVCRSRLKNPESGSLRALKSGLRGKYVWNLGSEGQGKFLLFCLWHLLWVQWNILPEQEGLCSAFLL